MTKITEHDNTFFQNKFGAPSLKPHGALYFVELDKNTCSRFMTKQNDSIFVSENPPVFYIKTTQDAPKVQTAEKNSSSDKLKPEDLDDIFNKKNSTDKNIENSSDKVRPEDLDNIFANKKTDENSIDDSKKFKPISQMKKEEKIQEAYDRMCKNNSKDSGSYFLKKTAEKNYCEKMVDEVLQAQRKVSSAVTDKQDGIIGSFAQGNTRDCWFLAGLKIIASKEEGAKCIKDSIKNNGDQTYTIKFKGAPDKTYTVSEKELVERAEFSFGDKDVKILEIAADKWRKETHKSSLDDGGYFSDAKSLILGEDTKSISSNGEYSVVELGKGEQEWLKTDDLIKQIPEGYFFNSEFSSKRDEKTSGFSPDHAYYAEKREDSIIVHDPEDTTREPKKIKLIDFLNSGGVLNY